MAHALPPDPGRRRRFSIGALVVFVVIAALAVAGWTLKNHVDRRSTAASSGSGNTTAVRSTTAADPSTTTSPSPATTSTPRPTTKAPATKAPATKAPTTRAPTTKAPASTTPPTPTVPLIVENNTGRAGLAADAQARFEAKGWEVTSVGNFAGDVLSTCAYYDPDNPANRTAAKALQAEFPVIHRIKPRFSRLPVGPIVVVLTTGYH
jgi:hypothetical protein